MAGARHPQEGGDGAHVGQAEGALPAPANTGALMMFPEAAVMQVQPLVVPELKYPAPSLNRRLLSTNQVAEALILENELTPLELNWPCAQSWKSCVPSGIWTGPDGVQGELDGN